MSLIKTFYGKISDSIARAVRLDSSTHTMQIIEYEHHEVHAGSHYFVGGYTQLDDTDTLDFAFSTPTGTLQVHMRFEFYATHETIFEIYENLNSDWDGTPVTPINNNRNSVNVSQSTLQSNPAINNTGDLIFSQSLGLTINPSNSRGGGFEKENEIVLKVNSVPYLFRFTSNSDNNIVSYNGYWYEHTPKN